MCNNDQRLLGGHQGPNNREPIALWIVPVADLGGVARHILDATRVGVPGWQIIVLCQKGPLSVSLQAQGATVIEGAFGVGTNPWRSAQTLSRVVRSIRPSLVHSHLARADFLNAWTPLPRGTRRVTTEHGIAGEGKVYHKSAIRAKLMAALHRVRFTRFDLAIAVSEATKRAMVDRWGVKGPISVIPNGVDMRPARVSESTSDAMRILALARLSPEKNLDKLIEAFAIVRKQHPNATLKIGGEGILRDDLEEHARKMGVPVSFPGYVDANNAMDDADIVVQVSAWENCSYTLLDAAARGLKIIATDVGGNAEILHADSLVGVDDVEGIAHRIMSAEKTRAPLPNSVNDMCESIARIYGEESSNGK